MSKQSKHRKHQAEPSGPLLIKSSNLTKKDLTHSQIVATDLFDDWYNSKKKKQKPILRIGGVGGSGKAQPVDIMIPTPSGMRRFGDLKVGDKVFNLYGKPVKVIGIYPQGVQETYKVTFTDGRYTFCNKDHIWTTITSKGNFKDRTLSEMMPDYDCITNSGKHDHKYVIPLSPVLQYDERPIHIDPYVMGAFIGNGCMSETALSLSSGNLDVPKEVARLLGTTAHIRGTYSYTYLFSDPSATGKINKRLNTRKVFADYPDLIGAKSGDKYIPDEFKYNTVAVRMALIQGLMDTDGHIGDSKTGKHRVSYTTVSTRLKDDVIEVLRSLGIKCNATKDNRGFEKYKTGVCWHISIQCPGEIKPLLFRVNRKSVRRAAADASKHKAWKQHSELRLINIEKVEDMEQMCIMVDDPDHIYITENFIPTHNTTWIKYIIDKYGFDAKDCYVLSYTGQAVNRLRKDGVMARTIHSTIMYTIDEHVMDENGKPIYRRGVPLMRVTFKPVKKLPNAVKLVIVDEASFLPEKLEKTLLGYNVPILEVGDPLQLPPVAGKQVFNEDNVDFTMTDVMRQHMESELYDVISRIRLRKNIDTHKYHDEVLFLYQQPTIEETFYRFLPFFKSADVIIVATNKHRQIISDLYRKEILKTNSPYPIDGERMICRQNNQQLMLDQYMLANGMQGVCVGGVGRSMVDKKADIFYMDFKPDVMDGVNSAGETQFTNLPCNSERLMAPFGSIKMDLKYQHPGEQFEYAHALTAHLLQGAQAENVLFLDSYSKDFDYLMRLRYVAVSRAMKHLTYLVPFTKYGNWFDLSHIEERMARWEAEKDSKPRDPNTMDWTSVRGPNITTLPT